MKLFISHLILTIVFIAVDSHAATLRPKAALGKKLYFDTALSEPAGQSCASCHLPTAGFADPDRELPVSRGIHADRFGDRNTPTAAYAMYSPEFHFDEEEQLYVGGQFYDGRASTLEEQAKQPLLNVVEMANPDAATVVRKVRAADYAKDFDRIFGNGSLDDEKVAYENIAKVIAEFERSTIFRPFTSKYDYYLAGKVQLSKLEKQGLELFEAEDKGNCAACHPSQVDSQGRPPLFTDFTYDNVGLPKNADNPFYTQSLQYNARGHDYVDLGLAKTTGRTEDNGKFKVATLRNVELTPPYLHNGIFNTLREVVDFYNTRDTRSDWGKPEIPENVNTDELGNLGLTIQEVDAIVAFMKTLTDGYRISVGQ